MFLVEPASRNQTIFVVVSVGVLPLIAVQLFLQARGHPAIAAILGLFVLAYCAGCFLLARKLHLKPDPRLQRMLHHRRKPGS